MICIQNTNASVIPIFLQLYGRASWNTIATCTKGSRRAMGLHAWLIQITIASKIAQLLAYLHSVMDPPIYQRDIKLSNIYYTTKIVD